MVNKWDGMSERETWRRKEGGGKKNRWKKTCVLSSSVVTELATWTSAVTNFIPGHTIKQ